MTFWPQEITGPLVGDATQETSKLRADHMEYACYGGITKSSSVESKSVAATDDVRQPLLGKNVSTHPSDDTKPSFVWRELIALDHKSSNPEGTATITETSVSTSTLDHEDGDVLSTSVDANDEAGTQDPFEVHGKLGVIPLAIIIFYGVSGGAFGVEETVRSAGNFYTLLGFMVMPFVWSVQEALMTAELGSAFPEASGGVAWVQEAYGGCAGWMSGYLNWVSGATDNAIYPVLFVEYLLQQLKSDSSAISPVLKFFLFSGMSCALAYMNWLGLPLVGKMSMTICFVAISPFIIMSVVGASQVDPSRWFEPPAALDHEDFVDPSIGLFSMAALGNIAWRPFLNNLFWNLNSFDSAAAFAADVEDPARVLPRAMAWSVVMVASCYFLPLLIALGASTAKQTDWVDGYFAVVAQGIAGPWLGAWLVFAAGISNIAMFQAELSSDAFQLMGMAERGFLPKVFATRSRHGTPTYGIIVGTIVIVCMTVTNLDDLIEMLNFNYTFALLLEYLAFLKLRVTRPDLERPYRVPLSTTGCIILFTPTLIAIGAVIYLATLKTWIFGSLVMIFGLLLFYVRERKFCQSYSAVDRASDEDESDDEMREDDRGQLA
ncbi:hypothetical protein ACA910_002971 [Epithemia clementina (nom. ined.)]